MKIFLAAAYSSHVNYDTGEVFPEYRTWLENIIKTLESLGYTVYCALRADQYKINNADPAAAFNADMENIKSSEVLIAILADQTSAGVQTELGMAIAFKKKVILAHPPEHTLAYFNTAILKAGVARRIDLPITSSVLHDIFIH